MRDIGEGASPDELYAWFVESLRRLDREARDVGDGVIELLVDNDGEPRRVRLLLSRRQLHHHAWHAYDVSADASDEDVLSDDPVRVGLQDLSFAAEETLANLRPDETFVVLDSEGFHGSTRRDLPPLSGADELRQLLPGGTWSTSARGAGVENGAGGDEGSGEHAR